MIELYDLTKIDVKKIYSDSVEMSFAADECKERIIRKWRL